MRNPKNTLAIGIFAASEFVVLPAVRLLPAGAHFPSWEIIIRRSVIKLRRTFTVDATQLLGQRHCVMATLDAALP